MYAITVMLAFMGFIALLLLGDEDGCVCLVLILIIAGALSLFGLL
jgi:hypothetical protein